MVRGEAALPGELRWLQAGCASIWLTTALGVLHPYYREVGHAWLARLGLPDLAMFLACAAELALGLAVLLLPPSRLLVWLQVAPVLGFTATLAALEPLLLAHPFGVLSKNLPFIALVLGAWRVAREGWSPRALWTLRAGMAVVWVTEGLFPKLLFQQPLELAVVERHVSVVPASTFLLAMGAAQLLSGVAALVLKGAPLRWLLGAQLAALALLPLLVSWHEPTLWVHPFGPLTKNLPILFGTVAVFRRCPR